MWYVINVDTGREHVALKLMETIIDLDGIGRAFIPQVVYRKKRFGTWRNELRPFVPGYIFFETETPERLFFELKKVPKRTSLLRINEDMLSVSPGEEGFIKSFLTDEGKVDFSLGHKEGDKVVIDSGALVGKEAIIKKIDAHHRTAVVSTEMFGRKMELTVGLLVLRPDKKPEELSKVWNS